MKRILVRFDKADQIANFVRLLNRYGCEADLKCGSRIVDARSIVAVLSLARARTAELILHSGASQDLMTALAAYTV